jgi:PAS domain S-box-containing protein
MNTPANTTGKWDESSNATARTSGQHTEMFDRFFERSAEAMWIFDPVQGAFVDCNDAAVSLMRASSKSDLVGKRPEELSPARQPDGGFSADKSRALAQRLLTQGGGRFEWLARRFDGVELPLQIYATVVERNDQPLHIIVSRDITLRKQAEAAARRSEQLLVSIADNVSEALYRTGPNHELIFANRAYLWLSGYDSLAEMQQVPRERLYATPSDRQRLLELLQRDGAFRNQEIEYIRRDGRHWWGLTNSVALRDPQTGAVLYHVGSVADITERKHAADEIQKLNASLERRITERTVELTASEARLRTLVEHAPEAIVVFDGDTGRFISGNGPACRLYGVDAAGLTQLTPAEASPEFQPDGKRSDQLAREKMDAALAGGTPVFEWIHRDRSSGRLIPTEVRLVRLPAEGKNLLRASITDNTERQRREKIQHATFEISEAVHTTDDLPSLYARLHAIIKTLMPAENFYIALLNETGDMFGFPYLVDQYDRSTAPLRLDQGLTGYVFRQGRPLLAGPHNSVSSSGRLGVIEENGERIEAIFFAPQAAVVWLGVPLTTRGRTFGVVALQDYENPQAYGEAEKRLLMFVAGQAALAIERKLAEQALRESEEKFRALFEASRQGVMLHDDHQYLEVNPAAVRILGYDAAAQLVGRHPRDTSPSKQPNGESTDVMSRRHIEACMANGYERFDWLATRADGTTVLLDVILTRIEWRGRQIIQAVIDDISDRKRAEEELLRSLAREKELGQMKTNFVSMVSHEFRTPLGIIQSSTEILADYLDKLDPDDRREQLRSIVKNTRRMADLMEEVLVLGRLDAGRMDFRPAPMDLPAFCERTVDEVMAASENRCPIELSCTAASGEFTGDERLLRHIFTNLLSNAVKYSEAGSLVSFSVEPQGPDMMFLVRDRGLGIPEADLPRLFNAFQRGRNVAHVPGTGLGLIVVKRCAELHGGTIKIESTVGRGTTAVVRIPQQKSK